MPFGNQSTECKPQPDAALFSGTCLIYPVKRLRYQGDLLRWDTTAPVRNGDGDKRGRRFFDRNFYKFPRTARSVGGIGRVSTEATFGGNLWYAMRSRG